MHIELTPTTQIAILGMKRMGKSTLARQLAAFYPNVLVHDTLWEHGDMGLVVKDHLSLWRSTAPVIVYQGDNFTHSSHYALCHSNLCFFIDEVETVASKQWIHPNLKQLINHGGHANIALIAVTRATSEIHNDLLRQANYLISFRQQFKNDLEFMRKWIDETAANRLPLLPPYHKLVYCLDTHTWSIYDGEDRPITI